MEARRNGVMFVVSSWVVTSASLGVWSAKSERNQLLLSRTLTCFFLIYLIKYLNIYRKTIKTSRHNLAVLGKMHGYFVKGTVRDN